MPKIASSNRARMLAGASKLAVPTGKRLARKNAVLGLLALLPFAPEMAWAQAAADESAADSDVIVVTAQRRAENVIDVPISIATKDGEALEAAGVTNLSDLTSVIPGVKIDNAGTYVQPALRGISSVVIGPGTEAPVAIYLDGMIQPNQMANHFDFADIDRVEVAKGPQGTLFGRNATGGAISIFTKAPSFTTKANISLGYGNYDAITAKAYATGPITSTLAGSISLYSEKHDGYNYNIALNERTKGLSSQLVRAKLLWQPSDNFSYTVIGYYSQRFDSDAASALAFGGNTQANLYPGAIVATEPYTISFNDRSSIDVTTKAVTGRGVLDLDAGTLTSITGYIRIDADVVFDEDRAFNPNPTRTAYIYHSPSDTFTQELSFASREFGMFSFVLGAYYYHDDTRFDPISSQFGTPQDPTYFNFIFRDHNPAKSVAGFGEVKLQVTDALSVIGGLRYSWEKRKTYGQVGFETPDGIDFLPTAYGATKSFDAFTPRLSVSYKLADQTNAYFTYSQGFKSGGVRNFLAAVGELSYDPEKVTAYEVGLKSRVSNMLSFNAAAYYYDYKDLQVQVNLSAADGYIQNAASAEIYGLDLDATLHPAEGLSFSAGVNLLHAQYKNYENATVLVPNIVNGVPSGNVPTVDPVTGLGTTDASGNTLPRAPKLSLTAAVDYKTALAGGTLSFNGNVFHSSRVYFDSAERISQKPYTILNAQISYRVGDGPLSIDLYGRNLTKEVYINTLYEDATTDGAGYGTPRTYGIRLNYSY